MGLVFEKYIPETCCLCGSREDLTGEHKVKASALRSEFGSANMAIVPSDGEGPARLAQGPKSKALHFSALVCRACNNARTQRADREFDRFNKQARDLLGRGSLPVSIFEEPRYSPGSEAHLNVFRYFAKLMCCHMADAGGLWTKPLGSFAIGATEQNPISLGLDRDWVYGQISSVIGEHQYAAHGGLVVYGNKNSLEPTGFHSTLTIGPLRYTYCIQLTQRGRLDLRVSHPDFYDWCRARVGRALREPLSLTERLRLGLVDDENG